MWCLAVASWEVCGGVGAGVRWARPGSSLGRGSALWMTADEWGGLWRAGYVGMRRDWLYEGLSESLRIAAF